MARFAVGIGGMVKVYVAPDTYEVTVGALSRPVTIWRYMATLTVVQAVVTEADIGPAASCVANRALTRIVIAGCSVTRFAVDKAGVIKVDVAPVAGTVVAVVAMPRIVACWNRVA